MRISLLIVALFTMGAVPVAYAEKYDDLGACYKAAVAKHPGKVTSVRGEIEKGNKQYELNISGKDGKQWEVECDAKTGKVLETEGELAANDPAFTSKAKITLDEAIKAALAKYPGTVVKIEYEQESDGVAYEFDIVTKDGKMLEVEVNPDTGESHAEEVVYQIGK